MYDILYKMIGHSFSGSYNYESYLFQISAALIVLLVIVFIDMIYRVFRSFLGR